MIQKLDLADIELADISELFDSNPNLFEDDEFDIQNVQAAEISENRNIFLPMIQQFWK